MSRSQYTVALLVLAIFGFLGGWISERVMPGRAEASNDAVITAKALIIQDDNGNDLVTIGSRTESQALISMRDPNTNGWIQLGFQRGTPLLRVSDGADLTTDVYPKGCTIFKATGPVTIWGINSEGDPNISFFRNKKPVASFGRVADGGAQLILLDQITQNAGIMGYSKAGEMVHLIFTNIQQGNPYWKAP